MPAYDYDQYFLSYTGLGLPLKLVGGLEPGEIENRNTFFGTKLDDQGRLALVHKLVYGTIELEHKYQYRDNGKLKQVEIMDANISDEDEQVQVLDFDENGRPIR